MSLLMKFGKLIVDHAGSQGRQGNGRRTRGGAMTHKKGDEYQGQTPAPARSVSISVKPDETTGQAAADSVMQIEILLRILPHLSFSQHLPGRLRLRADSTLKQHISPDEISLISIPGVEGVTVNPLTGSILVIYDPDLLPFSLVQRLFTTRDTGDKRNIAATIWPLFHQAESGRTPSAEKPGPHD